MEVFSKPPQKVRAMLTEPDHATAMFAQGQAPVPHPDLGAPVQKARDVWTGGPVPRVPTPAAPHLLVDEVAEARAMQGLHPYQVALAVGRLVRTLYTTRGWWEVKPWHWLRDLAARELQVARHLETAFRAGDAGQRQAALKALARTLLDVLKCGENASLPGATL
ncbi:hypothetical protein SAMN00790413_01462 [Deinococcus hopiensis KR-140]|uniref:Uncharacterized protein n=1 Tax=Deinococcus hopiensis KR-140 TaxID=695939 RepID=A0A1W1VFG5_9DEIO|nr:hypothetical protein SAMN00790413_01462 [Deinococcus hopiensis KR-140]